MKKKLFAAALSLVMACVLMVSSSFAWFTVSTAPTIDSIEVTMKATNNLEIAKATDESTAPNEVTSNDAGDETKWGNQVTSFSGAEINFPAKVDGSAFKTVGYDTDGRTNNLEAITVTAPALTDGAGAITHDVTNGPSGAKVAAVYGVWLRSNETKSVTVTIDSSSAAISGGGALATGKDAGDVVKAFAMDSTGAVATSISLTANEPKLVYIAVYADGDAIVASSVATDMTLSGLNVEFS